MNKKDEKLVQLLRQSFSDLTKPVFGRVWSLPVLRSDAAKALKSSLLKRLGLVLELCSTVRHEGLLADCAKLKEIFFKIQPGQPDMTTKWLAMQRKDVGGGAGEGGATVFDRGRAEITQMDRGRAAITFTVVAQCSCCADTNVAMLHSVVFAQSPLGVS